MNKKTSAVLRSINKLSKKYQVRVLSDSSVTVPTKSTGLYTLDYVFGGKGMPLGRIIEVFGPESAGKTTVCWQLIAQIQAKGGVAGMIDAEHAADPSWAAKFGVDLDNLLFVQPNSAEEALDLAEAMAKSCDIVVIDSVAAMVPLAEQDNPMEKNQMGLAARLMGKGLRKIISKASNRKCTVVFVNQIRMKIGVMFGNPETTTGGLALKYAASVRLDIRHGKMEKGVKGKVCRVRCVKNKVGQPFRKGELVIKDSGGFDKGFDLAEIGLELDAIDQRGKSYICNEETLATSYAGLLKCLRNDKGSRKLVRKALKGVLNGSKSSKTVSSRKSRQKVRIF